MRTRAHKKMLSKHKDVFSGLSTNFVGFVEKWRREHYFFFLSAPFSSYKSESFVGLRQKCKERRKCHSGRKGMMMGTKNREKNFLAF